MFVSSYNTYIQTNAASNTSKERVTRSENFSKNFASKLSENAIVKDIQTLPLDYVAKSKFSYTKQQIDYQQQRLNNSLEKSQKSAVESVAKFTNHISLLNAGTSYVSNTKMFSQLRIPHPSINKIPSIDNTLPKEPREMKELNMRHKMVNTYLENESYYKITA